MKWDNQKTEDLLNTILALKDIKEAKDFFRDLLTESELEEFSNRWLATQMLNNKISYNQIVKETGLSTTTIARISKWLQRGKGGYKLMLKRQKSAADKSARYNSDAHHHNSLPAQKGLS